MITRAAKSRAARLSAAAAPSTWEQLPLELLLLILTKLDSEVDWCHARRVSSVWRIACARDSFWRPLCEQTWTRNEVGVSPGSWSAYFLRRKLLVLGTETLPAGLQEKELSTIPKSMALHIEEAQQAAGPAWIVAAAAGEQHAAGTAAVLNQHPAGTDPIDIPDQFNKIFACAWPENRVLFAGTKDNKLLRWEFDRNFAPTKREVINMPDPLLPGSPGGGIHCISFNKCFGGGDFACGGNNPNTIMVMDYDTLEPRLQLQGNQDWMFSCCWVDRHRMVSGSRDCSVRVWSTDPESESALGEHALFARRTPLLTRMEHTDKIRDMKFNIYTKQIATMSTDGIVKIWDSSNFDVVSSFMAPESQDLVSMAVDEMCTDALVLGSRRHIAFIDPRAPGGDMRCVVVPNGDTGVRSLSFREHLVTIGCGGSHLLFYDTRMPTPHFCQRHSGNLHAGPGWIRQDDNFHFMFPEDNSDAPAGGPDAPRNAIYAHAYDASGKVLFTGGGPLQVGLFGCYGALWSR